VIIEMSQPFEHFYQVWEFQELLDYAYSKALQKTPSLPPSISTIEKVKRKEIRRIENVVTILIEKIKGFVASVPNLDELPIFYHKLSHLIVNNDELRKSLGRLNGVVPVLQRLKKEYRRKVGDGENPRQCGNVRVQFFGRCSSILKKQKTTLKFLEACRLKLKEIPILNLTIPSVVLAGYPNVGKTSIVTKISSIHPQISEYPFTTKQIFIGLYNDQYGSKYFQVIDTPGILDRPMSRRNDIEKQAILALNTISTLVLYVFDPTQASGYEIDSQISLFNEIRTQFLEGLDVPIKIIINKIDFAREEELADLVKKLNVERSEIIFTNAKDGEGVEKITKYLLDYFKETNYQR
jgi:nucleolar GTP-binding protein